MLADVSKQKEADVTGSSMSLLIAMSLFFPLICKVFGEIDLLERLWDEIKMSTHPKATMMEHRMLVFLVLVRYSSIANSYKKQLQETS